jgi:Xaa-Pro aminopeptidase
MKDRIPDAISVEEWILQNMKPGSIVAVDGLTISAFEASQISSKIAAKGISLNVELDLVSTVWSDRPIILNKPVYEHPLCFAGKSRVEKIELVRNVLSSKGLDSMVVSMLEDIAWLFNLRSDEIQYTKTQNSNSH